MNKRQFIAAYIALALIAPFRVAGPVFAGDRVAVVRDVAGAVPVIIVEINLNDAQAHVTGAMATGGAGHSENWAALIGRTRPAVAVTGTYFDIASRDPVGDLYYDGRLMHFGGKGTALCIGRDNRAAFVSEPDYRHVDFSKYDFAIRCGPRLVRGGRVSVHVAEEGFHDPALIRPSCRLGVGITAQNTLLLVATRERITLSQWARALRGVGAVDAMNLDAGASLGLYIRGRTVIAPQRRLTNLLLVYEKPAVAAFAHRSAASIAPSRAQEIANLARQDRGLAPAPHPSTPPSRPASTAPSTAQEQGG